MKLLFACLTSCLGLLHFKGLFVLCSHGHFLIHFFRIVKDYGLINMQKVMHKYILYSCGCLFCVHMVTSFSIFQNCEGLWPDQHAQGYA